MKCFLAKKFALWRATTATLMIQRRLLHMTAAPILCGGGMAWKVLVSPLAQVCIYFIVSIFFLLFFSIWVSAK